MVSSTRQRCAAPAVISNTRTSAARGARRRGLAQLAQPRNTRRPVVLQQRREQLRLGAEGAVDRASGDPDGVTDIPHRKRHIAAPEKQLGEGVEGGID